jgi:O-antigen/teichoic acid export membrane protein
MTSPNVERPRPFSASANGVALAWIRPTIGRILLAREPGFAAIQSVVLQLLTVGANLVTGVTTARLLGAEGRGVYAAATSWPSLLGLVAVAGVVEAVLMEIRRRPQWTAATVAWALAAAMVGATLLAGIAYLCMPALLGQRHAGAVQLARAALLITHIVATGAIYRYVFAGRGKFLLSNLGNFLPHLMHACAICAFALAGRLSVATAVASLGMGVIGSQIVLLPFLLREARGSLAGMAAPGAVLLRFAARAAPADLLALCCDWADRLLLIVLLDPRELGLYVVAYGFSRVVAVATPTNGLLLSAMARTDLSEAKQLHDLSLRFCIAALAIGTAVTCAASEPLIRLFYGDAFLPAAAAFKILALQAAGARVAGVTAQLYLACNRPGLNSVFSLVNVLISAALMVVLTPTYGAVGAAFGLLAGTLARLALMWMGVTFHLRFAPPRLWPSLADVEAARVMFRP